MLVETSDCISNDLHGEDGLSVDQCQDMCDSHEDCAAVVVRDNG